MIRTPFRKFAVWLGQFFLIIALLLSSLPAVSLNAEELPGEVKVDPDMLLFGNVTPGSITARNIKVGSDSPIIIAIGGLGQSTDSAQYLVTADKDTSIFTARPWVTLDKTQLPAGQDQNVLVMINVPSGAAPGQKFASLLVQSQGGAVNILIPIIMTVDQPAFTPVISGQLNNVTVPQVYQDHPVHILTTLTDTGNCLLTHARISVVIKDAGGAIVWQNESQVPSPSIMPGYPRVIDTTYRAGLSTGQYGVNSTITLADGQVLNREADFKVLEPIPPPATPVLIAPGAPAEPFPVIHTFTPTFQWNAVVGAVYYDFSILEAPYGPTDIVYEQPHLTGTSLELPSGVIGGGTEYKWNLVAVNVFGESAPASFSFQTFGTPIRVRTIDAVNVTGTTANLVGAVLALGTDNSVAVDFEYGLTPGHGQKTNSVRQSAVGQISIPVTGLTPNTEYYFRMHALGASDAWGGDMVFETLSPPPTIAGINPTTAKPGDLVTITGSNFFPDTYVTFEGVHGLNTVITSSTSLTTNVPDLGNSNINSVKVGVTNAGGTATSQNFNYQAILRLPTISGISPAAAADGATITISGTNFIMSGTTVSFNSQPSSSVSVSGSSALTASVPNLGPGALNNVTVTVTTAGGSTSSLNFNYLGSGAPGVTTGGASGITATSAILNGNLTSLGSNTNVTVSFEYGTGTSYGNVTQGQPKTSGGAFSASISGLTPETTYYFRAKAVGTTTVYGSDLTFKTTAVVTTPTPVAGATPAPRATQSASDYLLPGMDENSLVVFSFDEQANFASAVNEAKLEAFLTGFKGQGIIALARYREETVDNPLFSDPIVKGGTGKPAIKFVDVFVDGVRQGNASVTVHFSQEEAQEFDLSTLFLGYYFNGKWHRCSNIKVSTSDMTVSGEIAFSRLTGTVVGLGGDIQKKTDGGVIPNNLPDQSNEGNGIPWSLAGIVLGTLAVIGGVILVVERNRRKSSAK